MEPTSPDVAPSTTGVVDSFLLFLFRFWPAVDSVCRDSNFIGGVLFTRHQRTVVSRHFLSACAHDLAAQILAFRVMHYVKLVELSTHNTSMSLTFCLSHDSLHHL